MASLMKKLCDTMPLAGVVGALGGLKGATVGQLGDKLRFHGTLGAFAVKCDRPVRTDVPSDTTPIWGWEMPADAARVKNITCRVREDAYNNYVVLEEVEWGFADQHNPSDFRPAVQIKLDASQTVELPLAEEARLLTLTTSGGRNPKNLHWLWPLTAVHDPSLLHVFAYEISLAPARVMSLKDPEHPDAAKVKALQGRLQEINDASPTDSRSAEDFLFDDDLWDETPKATAPTGTVPEDVRLSLLPIRILVAVSLTPCREREDYQPGWPLGVGRLYPHIMVLANADLYSVDAGVRFRRPSRMTILDAEKCGCGEMLSDIGSLLVTDSNADAMAMENDPAQDAPMIFLANLFNYYVPDPFHDPTLAKRLITLVTPNKGKRNKLGLVDRDCTDLSLGPIDPIPMNRERVTKVERQGEFDNIHVAPKMIVRDKIDQVEGPGGVTRAFTTLADWKMDAVTMAPFCAHDCFHMHWRWTDNGASIQAVCGWGTRSPYAVIGAPMVPQNQKVGLLLLSEGSFSYLARADEPRRNEWQPFCHHGAGYALSVGDPAKMAKLVMPMADEIIFQKLSANPRLSPASVTGDWALFYWRLRYTFKVVERQTATGTEKVLELVERFAFKDKSAALKL